MGRKAIDWSRDMARVARYDYVKLRFPDIHPIHRKNVDEVILFAWNRLQAEHPKQVLGKPRFTVLDPAGNRPNGAYIVELFGFAAEAAVYLPAGWLTHVTYAHVKSFVEQPSGWNFDDLEQLFRRPGGKRNFIMRVYPRGNASGTKQAGTVFTLGSGKAATHLNAYQRPQQPVGLEGKFRDEHVHAVTAEAWDIWNTNNQSDDTLAWKHARQVWGQRSAHAWAREFHHRHLDPEQLFAPVTYDEWLEGGRGFAPGAGYDRFDLPEPTSFFYGEEEDDD